MGVFKISFFLLLVSNISSVFNYIFVVVITKYLTKSDLSEVLSVLSIGMLSISFLACVPSIYVMLLNQGTDDYILAKRVSSLTNIIVFSSFFYLFVGFAFFNEVKEFLDLTSGLYVGLYLLCLFLGLLLQIFLGIGAGEGKVVSVQNQGLVLSIFKVITISLFFYFLGASGKWVFISEFFSTFVSLVFLIILIKPSKLFFKLNFFDLNADFKIVKPFLYKAMPIAFVLLINSLLLTGDVVVARLFLSDVGSADYSVASNLSKVSFFIASGVAASFYSMLYKCKGDFSKEKEVLVKSLLVALFCGLAVSLCVSLYSEDIILMLYGEKYLASSKAYVLLSFSMAILSSVFIFFNYLLVKEMYFFLLFLFLYIFCLFVCFVFFFDKTVLCLSVFMLFSVATVFVFQCFKVFIFRGWRL